jgi:hypothetical protein
VAFKGPKTLPELISFLSKYNPATYATFGNTPKRERDK